MKNILIVTFLSTLFSCNAKSNNNSTHQILKDTIIGSTLENINNSPNSVIQFEIDKKLCFATINDFFKNYKHKDAFPLSLWVTVETLEKNDQGYPTNIEANLFNALEDSLIGNFISKTPFCYIGRTTRDGYREIMFYVADKAVATKIMNDFISNNSFKRATKFTITPDPTWESVSGFYQ